MSGYPQAEEGLGLAAPHAARDHPHVVAPPPVIFCGAVVLGLLADRIWQVRAGSSAAAAWVGGAVVAIGVLGIVAAVTRFMAAGNPLEPSHGARSLVTGGIYRVTRNPIYCGMTLTCAGIALLTGNPWILAALAGAVALVHYGVILREEAYLARQFGPDYLRYKAAVRRWL